VTDEDGLLAAIVERPEDDLPRLAYAEWLEEHGRPDLGATPAGPPGPRRGHGECRGERLCCGGR
jgi:uncharacterized protein (TIGR02996 family)